MNTQQKVLSAIALKHLGIATLEDRNLDSLDFHDLGVASVRAALEAAFKAGAEAARASMAKA